MRSFMATRRREDIIMPFHDGVYYPFASDTPETHSSAGITSLLNSPLSQHSVNGHATTAPAMTPSSGASAMLPFKFCLRRESVDWRRINAMDVDLVMSQLDVDALQEHLSMVTFCSLDGERCPRCQSPVDPALVKLLRLAQLTVEWLLHCQKCLTVNLHAAEERLSSASREKEQLLDQQKKQEEKMKVLTTELQQKKKVIRTQQSLLASRIVSSQKCPHCKKSFLNSSFLQNHMQRRHPDEYIIQLQSDSEKKYQIESLKSEISSLKEQIVQQQQALQAKTVQEKEQQSMHQELLRELSCFKAEEMARMDRKIEDSRDGMRREMEVLYGRNIQALNEVNQNLSTKHEKSVSPVQSPPERDLDIDKERPMQVSQKLECCMKKKDKKWESRLQEMKAQHESEKNQLLKELSRMQSSVSEHQEHNQRLQEEMGRKLQKLEQIIKAQKEQIRNISSNPPTKAMEVPVIIGTPTPEPQQRRVVLEEPVPSLKLDPIQELSEEEILCFSLGLKENVICTRPNSYLHLNVAESSSSSKRRPVEKKPRPAPEKMTSVNSSFLKKNPNVRREIGQELEQRLIEKLENLGVKPDQSGLKNTTLTAMVARMNSERMSVAKAVADYWHHRERLAGLVEQKLRGQQRGTDLAPDSHARSRHPVQVMQIRPRFSRMPSRASQATPAPPLKQSKTPQPALRTKTTTQPKTSSPIAETALKIPTAKSPPFSSEEESEEDEEEEEQPLKYQGSRAPQPRLNKAIPNHIQAGKASSVPALGQLSTFFPKQSISSQGGVTKMAVTKIDSSEEEDDWSEVSSLQETDSRQLQSYKDQNGNVEKKSHGKENSVQDLARKLENQSAKRVTVKLAGALSILPQRKDEDQELTHPDLEEISDWLDDVKGVTKPALISRPLRKSLDSSSTSVWNTPTGKGPRLGLTEAGAGSTLSSSLCSLSESSDSEDSGDKH
ncbi:cilium assembly protein DZIP1-like [Pholidichthys leucotaenia]